ncbi:MAG: molecular chaperone DnaJ [Gemmatimonadota bacterium]
MRGAASINAVFRPIEEWPGEETRNRQRSRFKASWSSTVDLLSREVGKIIKPHERPVLEVALRERDLRLDGFPRADARPQHPGVILSFESRFGPLRYPCDTFNDWQDNVRAIALALEALRAVDRYGVTRRGEQYTGWRRLAPAAGKLTKEDAARVIARTASLDGDWPALIVRSRSDFRSAYRIAVRYSHPDQGGTLEGFQRLQEAKDLLEEHHGPVG